MATRISAHDMSRFQRVITVEGGRVTGLFVALVTPAKADEVLIQPYDVTVWGDDAHTWGRIFYKDDFTAWVRAGIIDVPRHMIAVDKRDDIDAAHTDFTEALRVVATCAREVIGGDPS